MKPRVYLIVASLVILTITLNYVFSQRDTLDSAQMAQSIPPLRSTSERAQPALEQEVVAPTRLVSSETSSNKISNPSTRPFESVSTEGFFSWTTEDATDPENLRMIANNPEHLKTLELNSERTLRRQLVYIEEAFLDQTPKIFNGEQKSVQLPLFDGETIQVNLSEAKPISPEKFGEFTGFFKGGIDGDSNSSIQATSYQNYWNIHIDHLGKRYEIETRNLGEWLISEIDPHSSIAHECQPSDTDRTGSSLSQQRNPN